MLFFSVIICPQEMLCLKCGDKIQYSLKHIFCNHPAHVCEHVGKLAIQTLKCNIYAACVFLSEKYIHFKMPN